MPDGAAIAARDIVVALITACTTLAGSYFLFQGDLKKADADMVTSLHRQVLELQQQIKARDRDMFSLQEQITSLRIQLSKKYEASEILRAYLDAMPYPAWIKLADKVDSDTTFTMWHINDAYARHFNISARRYKGRTDFDIWPEGVAQEFYDHDLTTLTKMDNTCWSEIFPKEPASKVQTGGYVCKWVLSVDGRIGVAGVLIPSKTKGYTHD